MTISTISATIPIKCTIPSCSALTGFPLISSIKRNTSLPPSIAGIGRRFTMPMFIAISAASVISEPQPKEATVLTLCTTPIGPDISLRPYVPLSRLPNEIHISLPYEIKFAHAACITFTKLCLSP